MRSGSARHCLLRRNGTRSTPGQALSDPPRSPENWCLKKCCHCETSAHTGRGNPPVERNQVTATTKNSRSSLFWCFSVHFTINRGIATPVCALARNDSAIFQTPICRFPCNNCYHIMGYLLNPERNRIGQMKRTEAETGKTPFCPALPPMAAFLSRFCPFPFWKKCAMIPSESEYAKEKLCLPYLKFWPGS